MSFLFLLIKSILKRYDIYGRLSRVWVSPESDWKGHDIFLQLAGLPNLCWYEGKHRCIFSDVFLLEEITDVYLIFSPIIL